MATSPAKPTRSQEVYDHIRGSLLRGELPPGSKLKMNDFTEQYGVSLSVVREAVTRLAGEGLVEAMPQRGFAVAALTIDDLEDLTRTRVLIETLALAESIKHGNLAWEASVIATHHALANTPMLTREGHVDPAFTIAHRAFHHTLLAGCGSTRLKTIATGLRDCAELYQYWSQELAGDDTRDIAAEHKAIAELTVARDEPGATQALREHIERTTAALIRYAEQLDGNDAERTPA
ncbi:GntR family transcriptional regulator [Streptomyces sp. GMY01]|uniref:GntR family transcriptional regulator n=1 Tax=Streptomyces sp. GMY02 TaxID=1333528 RepID=UPI00146E468F|nr:GntR family transcriptional regulator [Streptomyces sp. GMY02]NMO32709.1 GntR family transcriptional regulator [Streptomyces sp. GMY02]